MELTGITGRATLITGAANGIGAGIAEALAQSGARLLLVDWDADQLHVQADRCRGVGADVATFATDLRDADQCTAAVDRCIAVYGRIDALVNVAGIFRPAPVLELSVIDYDATFAINTRAVFCCTQAAARQMVAQGSAGAVVTISSDMGQIPRPQQAAYCASKAAVTHLMRCFGLELAAHNIRCNSVLPGATETAMVQQIRANLPPGAPDEILDGSLEKFRNRIPLNKLASIADVANATLFLLSDQARHITMHALTVDGGGTLGV